MDNLPKDLAPLWRAFQGFGATSTPVDIKPDLDEGFLTNFGKLKTDDQKFGLKKMFQIFGKKDKEKDQTKDKLSKKKSENIAQQNQRRQSYRPLSYKDTAAKDEESHPEISSTRETSEESSTTTSKSTSTPTPSESTPTPSESTPTPSESTPTPSESTTTPSESSSTPSESTTTSETTSTSSETEDQESESSPSEESTVIDILDEEEESLIPEIDFQIAKAKRYRKRNRAIGKCFKFFCPCLTVLLYSKKKQYRAVKAMLGFPVGALFGYALHKLVLERFQLSPFANQCLCSILVLCMGISFALSTQIRCMCFLTIPILCGKTGRMYLGTFIISFILFGPITNITSNARESMRVMSCITALNLNHTVQRFKLMFKPVKEIVLDFVGAGDKIHEKTKQIEDPYKEIEEEIRDDEDVKPDISETEQLDKDLNHESRVNIIKGKFSRVKKKFGAESESKYGMKSEFRCE
ncbi:e3 ubiquitin-protein ligase DCST1, partial [Trichonephila inaurata madagascariensis]